MSPGEGLERAAVLLLSAAVGLAGMLVAQPPQGSLRGRLAPACSLLLHCGGGECLHLHHWLVCAAAGALVVLGVVASGGRCNAAILVVLGLLVGAAASDGVYFDLSLRRQCAVSARPAPARRGSEGGCSCGAASPSHQTSDASLALQQNGQLHKPAPQGELACE